MSNNSMANNNIPLSGDPRYQKLINISFEKPNFFNGKSVALKLLEERDILLAVAKDYEIFSSLQIQDHINKAIEARDLWVEEIDKIKLQTEQMRDEMNRESQSLEEVSFQRKHELTSEIRLLENELDDINSSLEIQGFGLFDYEHIAKDSVSIGEDLKALRADIKDSIRNKTAATAAQGFLFNNSEAQGRKFVNDMIKLMLRAYNAEAENAIKSVKSANSHAALNRLNRCKEQIEKLGSNISLRISSQYHQMRVNEIRLAFEHFKVLQEEKEKAREAAEELREQKRAEAELKKQQESLAKELKQKTLALSQLRERYMNEPEQMTEREKIHLEILEDEVKDIDRSLKDAEERAANLQAGYVYVISNIGAFGEDIIKIGMTRRVDPMERVKELSSASVPFVFDVHLIHYSENALKIEKELHKIFAKKRVNLMNPRKEHFFVTPEEVKEEIMKLDGSITTFNLDKTALDYYESVKIRNNFESKEIINSIQKSSGRRAASVGRL